MKTPTLGKADQCKVLISDMTAEEIESVVAYGKYWLHQLKRKKANGKDVAEMRRVVEKIKGKRSATAEPGAGSNDRGSS
jgi:hypothetical protein